MKRSEALKMISDELYEVGTPYNWIEKSAEKILKQLEQAGMRPPPQESYSVCSITGQALGSLDDIYEWEKE